MQQGQSQPELCVTVQLAPGMAADEERKAVRSVIERACRESEEARKLLFVAADDSLRAGAGRQFFQRAWDQRQIPVHARRSG